ncbi:MAG: hypothetical protein ACE5OZ_25460 [Candidatus Heimdallarchaeota archaeon]
MVETELETLGIVAGVTALGVVLAGFIVGLLFIIRSRKDGKIDPQFVLTGFAVMFLSGSWYGATGSFLAVLFTGDKLYVGDTLNVHQYLMLYAWAAAASVTIWIYLVFSLVKIEWRKYAVGLYLIPVLIMYFFMYILFPFEDSVTTVEGDETIEKVDGFAQLTTHKDSGLPDSQLLGIPRVLMLFFILTLIIGIAGTFLWVSMKTQVAEIKWKARLVGIGLFSYGLIGAIDAFLDLGVAPIIIVRLGLITSYIIIYIGYVMPNWLRPRLGLPAA